AHPAGRHPGTRGSMAGPRPAAHPPGRSSRRRPPQSGEPDGARIRPGRHPHGQGDGERDQDEHVNTSPGLRTRLAEPDAGAAVADHPAPATGTVRDRSPARSDPGARSRAATRPVVLRRTTTATPSGRSPVRSPVPRRPAPLTAAGAYPRAPHPRATRAPAHRTRTLTDDDPPTHTGHSRRTSSPGGTRLLPRVEQGSVGSSEEDIARSAHPRRTSSGQAWQRYRAPVPERAERRARYRPPLGSEDHRWSGGHEPGGIPFQQAHLRDPARPAARGPDEVHDHVESG